MRKLTLSLAVMAALLPSRGYPLGLGELELNSALNQELNAKIEILSAAQEDAEQLIVKLANREAFNRAGLDRPHQLQQLKFKVKQIGGSPYVSVYTKGPVREPYLSFLLEIDWPQGHLLREYTLLLDPPIYNDISSTKSSESAHPFIEPTDSMQSQSVTPEQQNAQVTHNTTQVANTQPVQNAAGATSTTITDNTGRSVNYQVQLAPNTLNTSPDQYRVKETDTLWSMSNRMRADSSVSVEQMMMALVRKNPEAFIEQNINGVKRGYILRIPSRDEATQITRQEAVMQAREHAALWREYSQSATSATPASAMEAEITGNMTAADQPRDTDGHLSIVSANDMDGSESAGSNQDVDAKINGLKQNLAMAREELESERLEKEDLQSRLAELEQRVQRVIEMDDGELAKLQADLAQSQTSEQTPVPAVEAALETEEAVTEEPVIEEAATEELAIADMEEQGAPEMMSEEGVETDDIEQETVSVEEIPEEGGLDTIEEVPEDLLFADEITGDEVETEANVDDAFAETSNVLEPPAFAQAKPKGFIDKLMANPKLLGIFGGGLAFILLLLALLLKRLRGNKTETEAGEWTASMDESGSDNVDLDATTEMMVDPNDQIAGLDNNSDGDILDLPDEGGDLEKTVFSLNDVDADTDSSTAESDEQDDVLAEADVYLAYGIYQQAEELLIGAIDENPERDDYRLKLLETHFAAKNAQAFEQLAETAKQRKGDDSTYWGRVAVMGSELCPASALFSGADLSNVESASVIPEKPQTTDLELDAGSEASSDDFDLGLDGDDDLGGLDESETQVLSAPIDPANPPSEMPADEGLDLASDLDGLESLESDNDSLAIANDTSADLEFDLGELGELDDDASSLDAELEDDSESDNLEIDEDFSLDFDAADLGLEEASNEAEDLNLDADLDLVADLELDEPAAEATDATVPEASLDDDIGELEFDSEELNLDDSLDLAADLELDEPAEISAEMTESSDDSLEIDLGDGDLGDIEFDSDELNLDEGTDDIDTDLSLDNEEIDLGIDDSDMELSDASEELDASLDMALDGDGDNEFDISELSEDIDEVGTKLDLAKAYIDMGDNDGARSILEEVKTEGNGDQQKQADELLQKTG